MKKIKYYYNTQSLRYERFEETLRTKVVRVIGFISATAVFAFFIVYLAYTYLDSPKEKQLKRELNQLKFQYGILNKKLDEVSEVLAELENRDDKTYRVILEAEPIPAEVRSAGVGGAIRYKDLEGFTNSELMKSTTEKLDRIRRRMYIQSKSYDELAKMIKSKEEMLASIPAIQPVANKDLRRIGSGFGMRIDPIYKVPRMHEGIDFTAPVGTPIYATGNGVVTTIEYGDRGYGNYVLIKHGYGYQTLYGHMSRIKAKPNQKVMRGDIIGYIGNTGKSTGPHCHYEVIRNGKKIDPINFFYNDLSPKEYQQLLEIAGRNGQSLD
jgi:murein DD-endopeptidase MepM/ murein hydrolase activator NlpD